MGSILAVLPAAVFYTCFIAMYRCFIGNDYYRSRNTLLYFEQGLDSETYYICPTTVTFKLKLFNSLFVLFFLWLTIPAACLS